MQENIQKIENRESELVRFRAIMDLVGQAIYIMDSSGKFLDANNSACMMLGYSREELLQLSIFEIQAVDPLRTQKQWNSFLKELEQRSKDVNTPHFFMEDIHRRKNGSSFPVEVSVSLITLNEKSYVVAIARDVSEKKRTRDELKRSPLQTQLIGDMIKGQEEERRRFSRELHDETGQVLLALLMKIRLFENLSSLKEAREHAKSLEQTLKKTIKELRNLAKALHPSVLDDLGLKTAIQHHAEDIERIANLKVHVKFENAEDLTSLPKEVASSIYRLVQEALTNVVKHAHARNVYLAVWRKPKKMYVRIEDDGRGISYDLIQNPIGSSNGLGLRNMRERVELLQGKFLINRRPNSGTMVSAEIPFKEERG